MPKVERDLRDVKRYGVGLLALAVLLVLGAPYVSPALYYGLPTQSQIILAVVLAVLIGLAGRFPLHISRRTKIVVDTSFTYAAVLLLPLPWAALAVGTGILIGALLDRQPRLDILVNTAAVVIQVVLAQCAYLLTGGRIPPQFDDWAMVLPLSVTAITWLTTERILVAKAVSLDFNRPFRAVLSSVWHKGLREELALILLGVLTTMLIQEYMWALVLMVVPVVLVYISLRNGLQLEMLTREAVEAMADVIDRRDKYTAGHSVRVSELAARIAMEMGLPWDEVETIRAAARVHDLGKIELDTVVLNKPGRLDDREWELMRRHPIVGAEIISRFPEFARGADYIRYHHERWDGTGYPYGLRGEEIPLGARIIAVADAFDAMTTDRPYRKALSLDVVMEEFRKGAGVQWDADVVDALMRVLGEKDNKGTAEVGVPVPA